MYVAPCFGPCSCSISPVSVLRFIWMLIKITKCENSGCTFVSPTHLLLALLTLNNIRYIVIMNWTSSSVYLSSFDFKLATDTDVVQVFELCPKWTVISLAAYVLAPELAIYLCTVPRAMLWQRLRSCSFGFLEVAVRMRGPCILFFINFFFPPGRKWLPGSSKPLLLRIK